MYIQHKDTNDDTHRSSCVRQVWTALFASCFSKPTKNCTIEVKNLQEDEVVPHPLVLLEGTVTGLQDSQQDIFLNAHLDREDLSCWPVATSSGRFKAFVLLPRPGRFAINLHITGVCGRVFRVEYAPPCATPYMVKFHYLRHSKSTDEGLDMSPDAEALQTAAIQKIRFNALVLQMAVAEMLDVAGLPRRTFALQFATDGLPEVTLFHSRSMTMSSGQEEDRSEMVPHGIESTGLNGPAGIEFKHIVVVDGVHFTAEDHCTEDGDGSEGLGFFNARGLHSWPSHLGEVTACCLNSTQMDGGTFKGNFASDIGEALQVFGHSLDTSIARKGIAHMNQLLCVYEVKPHVELPTFDDVNSQGWLKLNHLALHEVKDHGGPRWDSTSSQKLCASPWIWSPDSVRMYGPVGTSQGEDNQEVLEEIPTSRNLKPEEELRAIALDADTLLDEFWTLSRAELSEMENDNEVRSEGKRHWFVLVDGEHITRVDVCASTWIEGIQLHTNLRSSRWYGGTGGQKHMLQSSDGWRVATFFGSKSGQHVRTLGVKCLPLSSSPKPHCNWPKPLPRAGNSIKFLKAVGEAYEHGPNTRFVLMPDTMGAVVIRCGEYVEAPFRVLSPEEVAANCTNPEAYNYNDHVFELFPGEKIVKVEMSSGFWVDVVRLTTTLRVSPWFGGEGGSIRPPLKCPTGHNICGFHGTHGKKYVGALGILYCADESL